MYVDSRMRASAKLFFEGPADGGSGRYYFVAFSISLAERGMVQCEEYFGLPHGWLMGGMVHAFCLCGAFHRLLTGGIEL